MPIAEVRDPDMVKDMRRAESPTRSVLRHLDVERLREEVARETRNRQLQMPPVSVYRWWARRTAAVSGALVDAVAADEGGGRLLIADPFAGGGMIALTTLLRGHRAYAQDVNPWAAKSLATMLQLPDASELGAASRRLHELVDGVLAEAYDTTMSDGSPGTVVHTIRVAVGACPRCRRQIRMYPSALVSLTSRVDVGGSTGYLVCAAGHVNFGSANRASACRECGGRIDPVARYTTGRVASCSHCAWSGPIADLAGLGGLGWRVALVERAGNGVREIGPPTRKEVAVADAPSWRPWMNLPLIQSGAETSHLLRHGMRYWHDLYPSRQRVVLEALLRSVERASDDDRVVHALRSAIIGSVEMAGYASRWDPRYLKAYEAVANHRFAFTTLSVEPNVWGAESLGRGTVSRRLEQMAKASVWLDEKLGRRLAIEGPSPSTARRTRVSSRVDARVVIGSSSRLSVADGFLDAVITDPPYHDDVQYGQLSDLFRAWAGEVTGSIEGDAVVDRHSSSEATVEYQRILLEVFGELRRALRPGGHLVLSYANREPDAWIALFSALQEAGFVGLGYAVVLSENQMDHSKAGKRACNLDVLIDLVADTDGGLRRFRPKAGLGDAEREFCGVVGEQALKIGRLAPGWVEPFDALLRACSFIVEPKS